MKPCGYKFECDGREYKIIEYIGRGATTIAYSAECSEGKMITKCILKEYSPIEANSSANGKERFINAGRRQNEIRSFDTLQNQVPPVRYIFEAEGTAFLDVACFEGKTLDKLTDLTFLQYMEICLTIAKTVNYYHKAGFLCLDLKPENIFILQNSSDDTITQLVEFIDYDSIYSINGDENNYMPSYTAAWAAPEQLSFASYGRVSTATDVFIMGKLIFYYVFGRHSIETEHRGFSKYPFDEINNKNKKVLERLEIRNILTQIFRSTLRSASSNREQEMDAIIELLSKLKNELARKEFLLTKRPYVSQFFVGREEELKALSEKIETSRIVFLTGVGGIGKSTLVRNYIEHNAEKYDDVIYLEYNKSIIETFIDDNVFCVNTLSRDSFETEEEYYKAKIVALKRATDEKRVLLVVDNYCGLVDKDLNDILELGFDTVIVTRQLPPDKVFATISVERIKNDDKLWELITKNIGHGLSSDEKNLFEKIVSLVEGHTLMLELISRLIGSRSVDLTAIYESIEKKGILRFTDDYIDGFKDGVEVCGTLHSLIGNLFSLEKMPKDMRFTLKTLALCDYRGVENDIVYGTLKLKQKDVLMLKKDGWISGEDVIRVHSVIRESINNEDWPIEADELAVIEAYDSVMDIYEGYSDYEYMNRIIEWAEDYAKKHDDHIVKGIFYDMRSSYYDIYAHSCRNIPEKEYTMLTNKMLDELNHSIAEFEKSKDKRALTYLIKEYISAANIWAAESDETEYIENLLYKAIKLADETEDKYSINHCYINTTWASYYSRRGINKEKAIEYMERAYMIAQKLNLEDAAVIDIIIIPYANYYLFYEEYDKSIRKLEEAIIMCKKHNEKPYYMSKYIELLQYECDVYSIMGNENKIKEKQSLIEKACIEHRFAI